MTRTVAYGVVIESRARLPLLPAPCGAARDCRFEILRAGPPPDPAGAPEVLVRGSRGKPLVSWWREGRGVVLRYAGLADFRAAVGLHRVDCLPAPGTDRRKLAALFADAVLPLLLAWKGEYVLHASAVRVHGGAVGFLGPAGSGKSTLAAVLGRAGLPVLADDALLLRFHRGRPFAHPGPPAVRLDGRSLGILGAGARDRGGGSKRRVPLRGRTGAREPGPIPLLRVYVLLRRGKGSRATTRALPWKRAVIALADAQFHMDRSQTGRIRSGFVASELIARKGLVFEARIPDKPAPFDLGDSGIRAI